MQNLIRFQKSFCSTILEGLRKNMIAVIIVHQHHVIVASTRWDDKPSSLVTMNLASDFLRCNKTAVVDL
jgi:hypothetical protein